MHPAALFSLLWCVVLLLHFIFSFTLLDELPPLSVSTYFIFFIGVVAFSFVFLIQTAFWQKKDIYKNKNSHISYTTLYDNDVSLKLRFILLTIIVIGLPFFLVASYRIFIAS